MESQSPRGVATAHDFAFARNVYVETMRWIVERLFGWDQVKINPVRHFYKKQLAIEVARTTEPPRFISRANLLHWPPPDSGLKRTGTEIFANGPRRSTKVGIAWSEAVPH
jgi:hypothetical protein